MRIVFISGKRSAKQNLKYNLSCIFNLSKLSVCIDQLSSSSLEDPEDAELACTVSDLTRRTGHTFPSRETHVMDRDPDGRTRPHTPRTPTFMRRLGRNLQDSEPDLLHRCHFSSTSSLEPLLSPSRSKSPWRRPDPYDSPEVMFEIFKRELSCVTRTKM